MAMFLQSVGGEMQPGDILSDQELQQHLAGFDIGSAHPGHEVLSNHIQQIVLAAESSAEHALTAHTTLVHGRLHLFCGDQEDGREPPMHLEDDWPHTGTSEAILRLWAALFGHKSISAQVAEAWCSDWGFHCFWRTVFQEGDHMITNTPRCAAHAHRIALGLASTHRGAAAFTAVLAQHCHSADHTPAFLMGPYVHGPGGTSISAVLAGSPQRSPELILQRARLLRTILKHSCSSQVPEAMCREDGRMHPPLTPPNPPLDADAKPSYAQVQLIGGVLIPALRMLCNAMHDTRHPAPSWHQSLGDRSLEAAVVAAQIVHWCMLACRGSDACRRQGQHMLDLETSVTAALEAVAAPGGLAPGVLGRIAEAAAGGAWAWHPESGAEGCGPTLGKEHAAPTASFPHGDTTAKEAQQTRALVMACAGILDELAGGAGSSPLSRPTAGIASVLVRLANGAHWYSPATRKALFTLNNLAMDVGSQAGDSVARVKHCICSILQHATADVDRLCQEQTGVVDVNVVRSVRVARGAASSMVEFALSTMAEQGGLLFPHIQVFRELLQVYFCNSIATAGGQIWDARSSATQAPPPSPPTLHDDDAPNPQEVVPRSRDNKTQANPKDTKCDPMLQKHTAADECAKSADVLPIGDQPNSKPSPHDDDDDDHSRWGKIDDNPSTNGAPLPLNLSDVHDLLLLCKALLQLWTTHCAQPVQVQVQLDAQAAAAGAGTPLGGRTRSPSVVARRLLPLAAFVPGALLAAKAAVQYAAGCQQERAAELNADITRQHQLTAQLLSSHGMGVCSETRVTLQAAAAAECA